MLHDDCITRGEQNFSEIGVLTELGPNCFSHEIVLDQFPVAADGLGTISAHPGGNHRRLRAADRFLVLGASKFLRLEEML
jgi:hypothetical protein